MPVPATDTPGVRKPAGISRLGFAAASLAAAGSFVAAFVGLGGPPAPPALATPVPSDAAGSPAPVTTIYVQLPAPTAAPTPTPAPVLAASVVAPPKARAAVVTRQSGAKGGEGAEGGEQEGDD
jgi:hypothetical protein